MNIVLTFLENRYHLFVTDIRSYNACLDQDNECQCLRPHLNKKHKYIKLYILNNEFVCAQGFVACEYVMNQCLIL